MNADNFYGFLLILSLIRHGISVPIPSGYFNEETPDQGIILGDDITEADVNERYPRNAFSSPYNLLGNRWFPRSRVSAQRRQPYRRHYHLFHLTAKHPNAVSYHVIEKSPASRTLNAQEKYEDKSQSNFPLNLGQYQPYSMQPYYKQSTSYQSPVYTSPSYPYGQPNTVDTTYQDILQEVSNPTKFPSNPSSYINQQGSMHNDGVANSLEMAAKQFKLASADMNNMELASLIMYPVPPLHGSPKVHKKKTKSKRKNKEHKKIQRLKKTRVKVSKEKFQSEPKTVDKLVHKLIKNDKNEEENMNSDYDDSGSGSGSEEAWDEEDVSTTEDQGYTSSKRSEIPHVIDTVANSDEERPVSSGSGDENSSANEEQESQSGSGLGSGYSSEHDVKDDSDNENKSPKLDSGDVEDEESSGSTGHVDKDEASGMQESEFGSGYVSENDVKDDESVSKKSSKDH